MHRRLVILESFVGDFTQLVMCQVFVRISTQHLALEWKETSVEFRPDDLPLRHVRQEKIAGTLNKTQVCPWPVWRMSPTALEKSTDRLVRGEVELTVWILESGGNLKEEWITEAMNEWTILTCSLSQKDLSNSNPFTTPTRFLKPDSYKTSPSCDKYWPGYGKCDPE